MSSKKQIRILDSPCLQITHIKNKAYLSKKDDITILNINIDDENLTGGESNIAIKSKLKILKKLNKISRNFFDEKKLESFNNLINIMKAHSDAVFWIDISKIPLAFLIANFNPSRKIRGINFFWKVEDNKIKQLKNRRLRCQGNQEKKNYKN
jgi:hypothetical protein